MNTVSLFLSRFLLFFVFAVGASGAAAQVSDTHGFYSEAVLKAKLAQLEREPENFDLLWEVAVIASHQGAYDEAITALERLLVYFPRDPKLRIELGVMYFRLGSYNQAKRQFDLARTLNPNADELRRLARFEGAVRTGQSGVRFSNSVTLTFGHRSNILTTATGPSILVGGVPVLILPEQSGSFYSVTGSSKVTWTLDTPRADRVTARVWASYSDFDGSFTDFDRQSYGLELGYQRPVFLNFEGYALDIRGAYRLDDTNLLGQLGTFDLWEAYVGGIKQTNYSRTSLGYVYTEAEQPFGSTLRTGVVRLSYAQRLSPRWSAVGEVYAGVQRGNSQASSDVYGVEARAEYSHRLFSGSLDALTRVSLGYDVADARGVTPAISPIIPLDIDRVTASISEEISFNNGFDLRLRLQAIEQDSSLPNGEFDDFLWSISLRKRF
ncbi:MAG: tetratricopeptide repeat protein [Pseudomonadota bacterium]